MRSDEPPTDERPIAGSALDWLRYAKSDLELSRLELPVGVLLENLCFHAQQASEKALKSALIWFGVRPPRTHNIRTLVDLLSESVEVPCIVSDSVILTDYAVTLRYPGSDEAVTADEHLQAVELAEIVVSWVEALMVPSVDTNHEA